jgi:hypothetical protein
MTIAAREEHILRIRSQGIHPDLSEKLSKDRDPEVRKVVAGNPLTPTEILLEL